MNRSLSNRRIRQHPWSFRFITWLVIATQLSLPFGSQMFAAETANQTSLLPASPSTPTAVVVNRTVPTVTPPSPELRFSPAPTDEEIFHARVFSSPIISVGGSKSTNENVELAQALLDYRNRADPDDASALENFLATHANSPRYLCLLANLASHYRGTCQFSKALETWPKVWAIGKDITEPDARAIVDQSVAEWAMFLVTLGRMTEIEALMQELNGRDLGGPAAVQMEDVRSALWQMRNEPEQTFKCGPFSLFRIRATGGYENPIHPLILSERATTNGTSLTQMQSLARQMGMHFQMAMRRRGAPVPVPCMVHWKLGHFSALVKAHDGRYLVEDATFNPTWISTGVLDEEASGYFLIPEGPLPEGWDSVTEEEGQNAWGRSTPKLSDPNAVTPCDEKTCPQPQGTGTGMAQYAVHLLRVSLNISDAPVGYQPPVGPAVVFRVTYNERDTNQPAVFNYSNLGNQWTFDWLSYIQDDVADTNAVIGMRMCGGGAEFASPSPGGGGGVLMGMVFSKTKPRLVRTSADSYELTYPDGSKYFYTLPDGGTSPRKVFLTKITDPASNAVTFTYDSYYRIVAAVDAIGQVTTLDYGSTQSTNAMFYKITKVTDPFGRYATFQYNASGQLTNITDVIGMSSSFTYGRPLEADFINSLTTPYGTTTFTNDNGGFDRWLEITDPMGEKERVQFIAGSYLPPTEPANLVPAGFSTDNRWLRRDNTFYWDRKAMHEAPGNLSKARVRHWLSMQDNFAVLAGAKASEKQPLEERVWYHYPGQNIGDWGFIKVGTNFQPSAIARVLDDGSTQVRQFEYSPIHKLTKAVDPMGRTTVFSYDDFVLSDRPEDLLEVRQQVGTNSIGQPLYELLARFTYNSQHLPLIAVDASGKTNFFRYNALGQLTAITNALNQIITLAYDTNGYLTNIAGALPDAPIGLTYDGYGRVRTVTDSDGYSVTYDYDDLDRPTKVTYPDNTFEQIVYDKLDPVLSKDRRGHWSRSIYNARRQLTAVADALGRVTQFSWCDCGSLESIIDPLGRTTTWLRDLEGRVTGKVYPDATLVQYAYEKNTSRLKSVTDAKNQTTFYDYFNDDNLEQVTYSNAVVATPDVSFTYDSNYSRIITMTDGIGTTTYSYNSITASPALGAGRLASTDGPFSNDTITYGYDELGRITNRAINGVAQVVAYDSLGRVSVVTNALGSFTNVYVGATSRISTNFYPNGQTTTFSYFNVTNDLRLQTIWHRNGLGNTVSKFDYTYDVDGQIATWTQQADAQTPQVSVTEYDPVDQLSSVAVRSNSMAGTILKQFVYGYDKAGNRTSESIQSSPGGSPAIGTATHNNLNQLTSASGGGSTRFAGSLDELGTVTVAGDPAPLDSRTTNFVGYAQTSVGTNTVAVTALDYSNNSRTNTYQLVVTNNGVAETLTYDLNGNLTNMVTATATNSYEWDAADRLVRITQTRAGNPDLVSEFSYDGFGRRSQIIEKTNGVAVSTNKFLWCGVELCEERDQSGGAVTKGFFGPGEQISGTNYFFTYDHLGSVREMTDGSGTVRARYDYDPYGRRSKVSGGLEADFGFTGHYFHVASGLHLTLFRGYDADVARWLSRDPIEEVAGINLYSYVLHDPINLVDPFGLDVLDWLSDHAGDAYQIGGLFGNAEGILANALQAALGLLGADMVKDLAAKSGAASGCGRTATAIEYGAATVGAILLNAFGVGRLAAGRGIAKGVWRSNPAFPRGREWVEYSHFFPKKWGGAFAADTWWNGKNIWGAYHAIIDPTRNQFIRLGFKDLYPLIRWPFRTWLRMPNWLQGMIGLEASQALNSTSGDSGCQ